MSAYRFKLLAVDDQKGVLDAIELSLDDAVEFTGVTSPQTALELIASQDFDIVITDYNLGADLSGLNIFKAARENNAYVTACLMTGDEASNKMREVFEAFQGILIEKPFSEDSFQKLLARAKMDHTKRMERQPRPYKDAKGPLSGFVAESPNMVALHGRIPILAPQLDISIHMAGPTGTGKSTLARAIHELSGVKGSFQTVTCSVMSPELAYSTLFGHKKGSFTGATEDKNGLVAEANGGTLFLDELHLMPVHVQEKLMRVLDTGIYTRLSETQERHSRFRLITASSGDVRKMVSSGGFLPDLWYRISTTTLTIPGLGERKACIPKLVYRFLNEIGGTRGRRIDIEPDALDLMISFSWDGNIRVLQSSLRAICGELPPGQSITLKRVEEDLKDRDGVFTGRSNTFKPGESLPEARKRFELELIAAALKQSKGSLSKAASILDVPRQTLRSRMSVLGIQNLS